MFRLEGWMPLSEARFTQLNSHNHVQHGRHASGTMAISTIWLPIDDVLAPGAFTQCAFLHTSDESQMSPVPRGGGQ